MSNEPNLTTGGPSAVAAEAVLAWRGDRIAAGMAAKAGRGEPAGPVPLGYKKVRPRDGGVHVELDEAVAPLVREAFRLAALRANNLRAVVAALSERGLASKRGVPLSATALWRILTNPFYFGRIRYADETLEGVHEPLVTEAEFNRVQERLADRRRH
jgi:site-specific DNA recombinase